MKREVEKASLRSGIHGPVLEYGFLIKGDVLSPREFFTVVIRHGDKGEIRVTGYALMKFIEHPDSVITWEEFITFTNLSREALSKGIKDALERGVISRDPVIGYRGRIQYTYHLNVTHVQSDQFVGGQVVHLGGWGSGNGKGPELFIGSDSEPIKRLISSVSEPITELIKPNDARKAGGLKRNLRSSESVVVDSTEQQQRTDSRGLREKQNQALKALIAEGVYSGLALASVKRFSPDTLMRYVGLYQRAVQCELAKNGPRYLAAMLKDGWDPSGLEKQVEKAEAAQPKTKLSKKQEKELIAIATNLGFIGPIPADIARAFKEKPKMVRSWYYCVMRLEGEEKKHRAARFIKAVREGRPNNQYTGHAKNEVKICENGEEGRARDYITGEYAEFIQH
jgi:hypothetical protein